MAEGSHKIEQHDQMVVEIIGTLNLRFKNLNLYYEAGWTDSFCHRRCLHEHLTLIEAAECGTPHGAGWYVLAVENGTPRQLLDSEEEFVETRISGCFLKNDEFCFCDRHTLCLKQ